MSLFITQIKKKKQFSDLVESKLCTKQDDTSFAQNLFQARQKRHAQRENYMFNKLGEEREKRQHCGKTAQSQ